MLNRTVAWQDMVTEILEKTLPAILAGLSDPVDDVGAVAASALIPAAHTIVSHFPQQVITLHSCLVIAWNVWA